MPQVRKRLGKQQRAELCCRGPCVQYDNVMQLQMHQTDAGAHMSRCTPPLPCSVVSSAVIASISTMICMHVAHLTIFNRAH